MNIYMFPLESKRSDSRRPVLWPTWRPEQLPILYNRYPLRLKDQRGHVLQERSLSACTLLLRSLRHWLVYGLCCLVPRYTEVRASFWCILNRYWITGTCRCLPNRARANPWLGKQQSVARAYHGILHPYTSLLVSNLGISTTRHVCTYEFIS
jgi:hypothetical protein